MQNILLIPIFKKEWDYLCITIRSDLTDTYSRYYNQDMLDIRKIRDNYYDNSAEDILTSAYIIPSDMAKKTTLSLNKNFLLNVVV